MRRCYANILAVVLVTAVLVVPGLAAAGHGNGGHGHHLHVAEWTYAIYMDGDNNLETYWEGMSLPMCMAVTPSPDVNIVALVDKRSTEGVEIQKISGSTVTVVESGPEMNMGDPATVTWWIDRATALFPSNYFCLSMWDHGYAWRYVCKDTTSDDRLSMPELQASIADAGRMIDILAFDCCNMGNIEVAYQMSLTNLVSYMVGSEETVPGNGFPYDLMLSRLVDDPTMLPRDFSIAMVDAWGEYYSTQAWANTVNLAAIDVLQVKATMGVVSAWSADMTALLPTYESAYATALKKTYVMWATRYFPDLYDYGTHLLTMSSVTDSKLRSDTIAMQNAVASYCIGVWNGDRMQDCAGISLYWGAGWDWADQSATYLQLAFALDTGWGAFLTAYNA